MKDLIVYDEAKRGSYPEGTLALHLVEQPLGTVVLETVDANTGKEHKSLALLFPRVGLVRLSHAQAAPYDEILPHDAGGFLHDATEDFHPAT